MDFQELALRMSSFWALGLCAIFCAIRSGHKDLLKIKKEKVYCFLKFMLAVTIFRIIMIKIGLLESQITDNKNIIETIPWQGTLFVFWEDAVHTLPIMILSKILNNKWYSKSIIYLLLIISMFVFGMGHTYQGYFAAIVLSFYIPFTFKMAKEHGLGTVMVCHTLYDLITILTLKILI